VIVAFIWVIVALQLEPSRPDAKPPIRKQEAVNFPMTYRHTRRREIRAALHRIASSRDDAQAASSTQRLRRGPTADANGMFSRALTPTP
jgi:hypothetical protein